MKEKLIKKAIEELENPACATTEQYLEVLTLELENGKPKIERIDFESFEKINAVYFPVENEPFFLVIYFDKTNHEITGVSTENGNRIYLTATSEKLTFKEMSDIVNLGPLTGWSVNDLGPNGKSKAKFSRISFEPVKSRAYDLEAKLTLLLSALEKDIGGIRTLAKMANAYISICNNLYIDGNKGISLDEKTILRLSKLNLSIDIDQYVYGNELKSVL